jgi:serine/threonine protein phosphatase PrpC
MSLIGEFHLRNNMPNQDSWSITKCPNCRVIAVSDGLGSKKHSALGSKMACKAVMEAAKHYCNSKHFFDADNYTKEIYVNWLKLLQGNKISDCCATCLFAVKYKDKIVVGQLGDGIIAAIFQDSSKNFILIDLKEESFSNITNCLNEKFEGSLWKTRVFDAKDCCAIVLYTDGISEDILPNMQIDFAREFYLEYRSYGKNKRKREIKKMLKNWHGSTDDKTIACLPIERSLI